MPEIPMSIPDGIEVISIPSSSDDEEEDTGQRTPASHLRPAPLAIPSSLPATKLAKQGNGGTLPDDDDDVGDDDKCDAQEPFPKEPQQEKALSLSAHRTTGPRKRLKTNQFGACPGSPPDQSGTTGKPTAVGKQYPNRIKSQKSCHHQQQQQPPSRGMDPDPAVAFAEPLPSDLVGKELVREWIDTKGHRKVLYGTVKEWTNDCVLVEYSSTSLSHLMSSTQSWPEPTVEKLSTEMAWGCLGAFSIRVNDPENGRHAFFYNSLPILPHQVAAKWIVPDAVQEVHSLPPHKTLTFRDFVLRLEARPSEIPSAGWGVFVCATSLRQGGSKVLHIQRGEKIDLGVYTPLRREDLRSGTEAIVKSFLFEGGLEDWAFPITDHNEEVYDITCNTTGELHDIARHSTLTYVNETDGKTPATVQALRDPFHHVHYLLGPAEGQSRLSIPCGQWMEIKVDYGSDYENVRIRKGYSRIFSNTPETQTEQRHKDKLSTLRDIEENWELEEIVPALLFIERLDFGSMDDFPKNRALLILLTISRRMKYLEDSPARDEHWDWAWTSIAHVASLISYEELVKTFAIGDEGRALTKFLRLFGTVSPTPPSLQAALNQLPSGPGHGTFIQPTFPPPEYVQRFNSRRSSLTVKLNTTMMQQVHALISNMGHVLIKDNRKFRHPACVWCKTSRSCQRLFDHRHALRTPCGASAFHIATATRFMNEDNISILNNSAATSLADGDLATTLSALHLGLQGLRWDVQQEVTRTRPDAEFNLPRARAPPTLNPAAISIHQSLHGNEILVSPCNAFVPFAKAFMLPESDSTFDGIAIVLLYNFGVALQRQGIHDGIGETLLKAQKMLQMSQALVEVYEHKGGKPSQLLALALWNNLGYLHSHFHEREGVVHCRERMRHYFFAESQGLTSEDFLFFHQAILFLDTCDIAARAGAA